MDNTIHDSIHPCNCIKITYGIAVTPQHVQLVIILKMFYKTVDYKTTGRLVNIHLLCFSRNISTLNMLVSACVSKTSFDILPSLSFCADKDRSLVAVCLGSHRVGINNQNTDSRIPSDLRTCVNGKGLLM